MKSSPEQRTRVGSSRLNSRMESSRNAREELSGSVASDTHGTGALLGGLTGVRVYIAGVVLACAIPLGGMTVSALAGADESVSWGTARPHDTASVATARTEGSSPPLSAGQKVAVGAGTEIPVPTVSWGVAESAPIATDYTGSERVVPAALWSAVVAHFPESERIHALRIAYCESRYKADASNSEGARGLFQVMPVHGDVPSDVDGQVAQAARIQREHSWSVWDCN